MKKWIKKTISAIVYSGSVIGGSIFGMKLSDLLHDRDDMIQEKYTRLREYNELMTELLLQADKNNIVAEELNKRKISSIAIYGKGSLGEILQRQLTHTGIIVDCFVDKGAEPGQKFNGISVIRPDETDRRDNIEAIVVTPICDYSDIERNLREIGIEKIILSFEDLVYVY